MGRIHDSPVISCQHRAFDDQHNGIRQPWSTNGVRSGRRSLSAPSIAVAAVSWTPTSWRLGRPRDRRYLLRSVIDYRHDFSAVALGDYVGGRVLGHVVA